MRRVLTSLIALTLVAATACDRQPVGPPAGPEQAAPDFNFNNNPWGGSEHIFRSEYYAFFVVYDTESPLAAVLSSTPDCGGLLEPADRQRVVEDPYDPIYSQVHELLIADPVNIFVVDLSRGGACFGFDLVASGEGKLVNTDNDYYAFFHDRNNSNAFGFRASGKVFDADGGSWHFNGMVHQVWDGEDFATLKATEQFNLKPTGN